MEFRKKKRGSLDSLLQNEDAPKIERRPSAGDYETDPEAYRNAFSLQPPKYDKDSQPYA